MGNRKKYPIGVQNFETIIRDNYLYVDKTEYVHSLVDEGKYYFLSRPRRFGKSLLLSTLEAYFLGKRELFKGLAIDEYENLDWQPHPVLHLDLNSQDYTDSDESLVQILDGNLKEWEARYVLKPESTSLSQRLKHVIISAYEKTGHRVVILIDEYDRPLLQNLRNEDRQERFRNMLKGFFGVLKSCDQYIKFAFLTGITKFGQVSVFSDLNNLEDITLDNKFNGICGITESELLEYMRDGIEELAESNDLSFDETCEKLKRDYDGYRFCRRRMEGIYNPFSVLNVLKKEEFGDYWFMTGTPTMLIELLKDRNIELERLEGAVRSKSDLQGMDPVKGDPIPVLFQSGYLTIKDSFMESGEPSYRLGFPNEEVERGFLNALLPFYTDRSLPKDRLQISRFISALRKCKIDEFMRMLKALMAGVPYSETQDKTHEGRFRDVLFIICRLMGLTVNCELHTHQGRIDMTVETDRFIYVIEFKVDKTADEALAQIDEKRYTDRFLAEGRTVMKVGVEFSSAERNIADWKYETE